jgi:hypothetical protein
MTENNHDERRQFSRIPFDAHAHLNDQRGELHLNCTVLDISLKGLLIEKPDYWIGEIGADYDIDVILDDANLVIKMGSTVAHIDNQRIGFKCQQLDLDSMSHLKRLISLNLGDDSLLHRELSALITTQSL